MRVLDWEDFVARGAEENRGVAAGIGVFDGVHRGHQELLKRIGGSSLLPAVITFAQNPKRILNPRSYGGDIMSPGQKLRAFEERGIALTVLIDFSENFSKLTGREFIGLLKKSCRLELLVLGENFRCGHRLDTGAREIRAMAASWGLGTELLEPVMDGGLPVSSSRIREAVSAGNMELAASLLGRNMETDLSGVPFLDRGESRVYDAAAAFRLVPRDGLYKARLYGADSVRGAETRVSVINGKIAVPEMERGGEKGFEPEKIEFLEQVHSGTPCFGTTQSTQ
ncbi:MAG: FAD synthetase family protein [Treponema sp.]|jgi:FAD synthase|nr:FAD synthetase family protein [Treponema sp.]